MNGLSPGVRLIERIDEITTVHHVASDGRVWGTRGRSIYFRRTDNTWTLAYRFPFDLRRDTCSWNRLLTRASRADKCNLFVTSQGRVLGIRGGTVFALEPGNVRPVLQIAGDCTLQRGICEDASGGVYIGEYFSNAERRAVRLWRLSSDLQNISVAYEFPAGSVRHVHGIFRDPFAPFTWWVTVGDRDGENFLYQTDDAFRTLRRWGDGTQTWRAVSLFFTPDHVAWLTDSHTRDNHACRMRRETAQVEIGQEISSSTWYGTTTSDGLHIAFTTVEDGPGIKSDKCLVLVSTDAFSWQVCGAFQKDLWRPYRLFRYGSISCPTGTMKADAVYMSLDALTDFDGSSLKVDFAAVARQLAHTAAAGLVA